MKKFMIVLTAAFAAAMPLMAETEMVGDYTWTYRINGEAAEISGISPKPTGILTIPSTLGGKTVTSIGDYAFSYCSGLTSVTIPDSVTSIGNQVFENCCGLTSVTIPDSVTGIGDYAFYDCSGLVRVTLGKGLKNIGKWTFASCNNLKEFVVADGNPSYKVVSGLLLGEGGTLLVAAPARLSGDVVIPDGVSDIWFSAFYNCTGLTGVTIPNSVTSIGDYAFYGCSGLTSMTIPNSVTNISGIRAFEHCGKLLASWYRTLSDASVSGGSLPSVVTTVVQQVESPYALSNVAADHAIASVTVDEDCAIDEFVLKDGKVYDSMLRIVNTANREVKLTLPAGYVYETFKGVKPLTIPANSRNMLSITRTADKTFLVSREELETVQ